MRIRLLACITIIDLILGIYIITSVISLHESETTIIINSSIYQSNRINDLNIITTSEVTQIKSQYDYYFRIDYIIIRGICQPLYMFNTSETIHSIQKITNQKINQILSYDITINLQILKIHTKLEKSERIKQKVSSFKSRKLVCSYVLELLVGIDFPSYCNNNCRSIEVHRIISDKNLLNNSSIKFSIFKPNSFKSSIEYNVQNVILYQTIKYFEEVVFIQSIAQNRYISITILDSYADRTSVLMSTKDKSLFIIKQGLTSLDPSSIYVSFVLLSLPNLYLRHKDGRVRLAKNDQSVLFQQDATFKLIFDHEKDLVAFQTVNLSRNYFLTLDNETQTTLILIELEKQITIDKLDNRFLFKIIKELF